MYQEFNPKQLSNLVRAIWFSDSEVDPHEGHVVSPSLGCQLVIKIYRSDIETVLSGPVTQQKKYPYIAGASYFGVKFAPTVGTIFDNILLKDLKDSSIHINNILGIDLHALAYQLQTMSGWFEQKHLLEQAIIQKYPENKHFLNQNVLWAMNVAHKLHGNISVKELAATVGISKRQLERLFLRHSGVSPKTFCTTLRMQRVLNILSHHPAQPLAQVALKCGFTDQAHLANEFKRTMGAPILTYLASGTTTSSNLAPQPTAYR